MGKSAFILVWLLLGAVMTVRLILSFNQPQNVRDGQQIRITTRLTEVPQIEAGRQEFRIKIPTGQRVKIITGLNQRFQYGDNLALSGKVKIYEKNGIKFFTISFPSIQIVTNDHNIISRVATYIRRKASDLYGKSLSPTSAGLLNGIVFGGNQDLPKDFLQKLQVSGVVHVIAASGMNVTFVAGALIAVLGALFRRQTALTIAIFGVIFYLFLTGFEPSIVRAAIMAILAFTASLLGKQNFALGSVFLTGFLMLIISPNLLFDVGFQLSFLATLGILFIKPLLPLGKLLGDDVGTTISAQLATIPILLGTFGSYGLLSVLVNALVLWTVPLLMIIGSIGLLIGLIFEPAGRLVIFLAAPILWFFEQVVLFFGNLGWSITIPKSSGVVWIGYYLILLSVILLIQQKRAKNTLNRENAS